MKITLLLTVTTLILIGLIGFSTHIGPVLAETDASLPEEVKIWDDREIYTAVLARHFELPLEKVREWRLKCRNGDDLAVALFVAAHCGKTPEFVMILGKEGASWWETGEGLGIDPEAWFLQVAGPPPAPFGDIYHRWEDATRNGNRLVLSDTDCRHLVAVRVLHEYFTVSAETAMGWRIAGQTLEELTADEYRARHIRGRGAEDQSDRASLSR